MAEFQFPRSVAGNPVAMAMWARALHSKDKFDDAFAAGLAAVEAAPGDTEVRDLVASALSSGIPDYHVPMLHDEPRNRAYVEALARLIRPGMKVLEIGTGAGLLSLAAARAGARVTTCERQPLVAAAARAIAERNGLGASIRVIGKLSTDLKVGVDLDEPADLLMSELFDDSLFGDGIVDFIADAKARLLKPGAVIVPARAELRCALVSMRTPRARQPLGTVEGFDLSAFNILAPPSQHWQRFYDGRSDQMSQPRSALAKDFAEAAPFGPDSETLGFRAFGGQVDALAQWLRIDFGAGIAFENDPFTGTRSHWGMPIYKFAEPIDTDRGQPVEVTVRRVGSNVVVRAAGRG